VIPDARAPRDRSCTGAGPRAPELAVSIPLSERLFGQGASARFDNFRVKTVTR